MKIETVKELEFIYLINNSISVPKTLDNADYQLILEWVKNGGAVESDFDGCE